jgi:hypothetical protein
MALRGISLQSHHKTLKKVARYPLHCRRKEKEKRGCDREGKTPKKEGWRDAKMKVTGRELKNFAVELVVVLHPQPKDPSCKQRTS